MIAKFKGLFTFHCNSEHSIHPIFFTAIEAVNVGAQYVTLIRKHGGIDSLELKNSQEFWTKAISLGVPIILVEEGVA